MSGNAYKQLATMVDAVEKLALLPNNELVNNEKLVAEIRNAFSVHNIDSIINSAQREIQELRNNQTSNSINQNNLIHIYAQREHERLQNAPGKAYETTIVNAKDEMEKGKNIPEKANAEIEEKFSSAFNTVFADGALKVNVPGDPSTLMSYINYTPYRINYIEYLSMPTLSEMVDRPLAIALKKFPKIKSENKKFNEVIEKLIHKKKIKYVIKDALFYSLLSPRGALVVPVQRGDSVTFNVFNDTQFAYAMGTSYSGITQPYSPMKVGTIYCMGAKLKHGVSAFFTCPGFEPLFGVGLNKLPQLRTAAEAWNIYIHILKILLVRAQVIIEKMEGDIQTDTMLSKMRSQLQRLSQTMGVSTPIEQARGMELDILNNNIGPGTADIAQVFRDYVGSVTGIAPEYFFGGGTAAYSQAAFQIHATNENIKSQYQHGEIEPLLRFMINTMIQYDSEVSNMGVAEDEFAIEFDNIYDETEQEKADLNSKRTEILIRQASYPELEEAFKKEGLLTEEIKLPEIIAPAGDGGELEADGKDNQLTKPLDKSFAQNTDETLSEFLNDGRSKDFKGKYDPEQLKMGIKMEMEHTDNPEIAEKIAKDHLAEMPDYYTHLVEMEEKAKAEK